MDGKLKIKKTIKRVNKNYLSTYFLSHLHYHTLPIRDGTYYYIRSNMLNFDEQHITFKLFYTAKASPILSGFKNGAISILSSVLKRMIRNAIQNNKNM